MDPQFLIDVNQSDRWVDFLQISGYAAVHWSAIGPTNTPDEDIMAWALANRYVVFTGDLDFSDILFTTGAAGPSVLQLRAQDPLPDAVGPQVVAAIRQFEQELTDGALLTVEPARSRVRVLPIVP